MDIDFIDTEGRELSRRKTPVPPGRDDIVLLPPPFPENDDDTATMDAATFRDPIPYRVQQVIWDFLGHKVTLIVEQTKLP